jgi:hypothetical protein
MKKNYTTPMSHLAGTALLLLALLILPFGKLPAQDNPFGLQAVDVFRCGDGPVTLVATVSPTTIPTENIRWYTEPFYGTPIESGPTLTIDMLERSTVFFIDYVHVNAAGQEECGICDRIAVRATVFRGTTDSDGNHIIESRIFYQRASFCDNVDEPQEVTHVGSLGGEYSANPHGLNIDPVTGAVTPHGSPAGIYTITYTPPVQDGCYEPDAITTLTIQEQLDAPDISYPESSYCSNEGNVSVTLTGSATSGFFSASPAGLTIDASTGEVTPSTSQGGDYTITYTVPGLGGCELQTATAAMTIETWAFASIAYDGPYCSDDEEEKTPLRDGISGGTFAVATGPGTINNFSTTDGGFKPSDASHTGIYTITYTIAATSICPAFVAETAVSINPSPNAEIWVNAPGTSTADVFVGGVTQVVTFSGKNIVAGTTPYTFYYKDITGFTISLESLTGVATLTHSTDLAGTFTYTLVELTDVNGCTKIFDPPQTVTITVTQPPELGFYYAMSPYCSDYGTATPTFLLGAVSGTFTADPELAGLVSNTGYVDTNASTPGTYTVTNTSDGFSATAQITITQIPVATISYTLSTYCAIGVATPTVATPGGIFSSDNVVFIYEPGVVTGTIDLRATGPGKYTVTYRIPAAGGCPDVSYTTEITIESVVVYDGTSQEQICSGETTNIRLAASLDGSPVSSTFTWTIGTLSGSITGYQTSAQEGGTFNDGDYISQTLTNSSGTTDGFVEYIITPAMDGASCPIEPETVVVTVKAVPRLTSLSNAGAVCSGTLFEYTPESDFGQYTLKFNWSRPHLEGIDPVGGATETTGVGSISETLTNDTTNPIMVTYNFELEHAEIDFEQDYCKGLGTVTVTVNPSPVCTITGTVSVVSGTTTTYEGPAGVTSYTWTVTDGTGAGTISGTYTAQTVDVVATATGTFDLDLEVTDENGCTATCTLDITVTENNGKSGDQPPKDGKEKLPNKAIPIKPGDALDPKNQ